MTELFAKCVRKNLNTDEILNSWCICAISGDEWVGLAKCVETQEVLKFAREQDAVSAIKALQEKGITSFDDIKKKPRPEIVRICCEAMAW